MKRCIIIFTLLLSLAGCEVRKVGFRAGYISCYMYFNPDEINVTYESGTVSIELSSSNPNRDIYVDEMKLIMNNIELGCTTLPTASQHHVLTISFDLDTDRTVTYEVELDFAAAENN